MARQTLLALLTLALIVTPAHAQTGKVLLDMTVQAQPDIPTGHCFYVDDGRILVEARLTGEARQPARFSLGPAPNVPSSLDLRIRATAPSNGMVQVTAGVSCYTLVGEAAPNGDDDPDNASQLGQLLALRIIWLPGS